MDDFGLVIIAILTLFIGLLIGSVIQKSLDRDDFISYCTKHDAYQTCVKHWDKERYYEKGL